MALAATVVVVCSNRFHSRGGGGVLGRFLYLPDSSQEFLSASFSSYICNTNFVNR